MQRPRNRLKIRDFTGLFSNRGATPPRPGDAKLQVNLRVVKPGCLQTRRGLRPLYFDS